PSLFDIAPTSSFCTLSLHDALPISSLWRYSPPPTRSSTTATSGRSSGSWGGFISSGGRWRRPGFGSVRSPQWEEGVEGSQRPRRDRKSTRLNSSHEWISYAVFCLKK